MNFKETPEISLKKLIASEVQGYYFPQSGKTLKESASFLKSFRVIRASPRNLAKTPTKPANKSFFGKDFSYASYLINKTKSQST